MNQPAVLSWSRSAGRCVWTGFLGALGLLTAALGIGFLISGTWAGAVVMVSGLLAFVLSEVWARRFRRVTTAGLHWQGSIADRRYPWPSLRFSLRRPPGSNPAASDRILVDTQTSSPQVWPWPKRHRECLVELTWWQRAQAQFPDGNYGAFPGLYQVQPGGLGAERRVHNPGRRWCQGLFTVACLTIAVAAVTMAVRAIDSAAADPGPVTCGWLVVGMLALAGGWVSLRNACSSVRVYPDRIVQRRVFAQRTVPVEAIAGSYLQRRPFVVGLGFLLAIVELVSGEAIGDTEGPAHQRVPTVLLRDGTAVALPALVSRSRHRAGQLVLELLRPPANQRETR